jgi:hypothetical protein
MNLYILAWEEKKFIKNYFFNLIMKWNSLLKLYNSIDMSLVHKFISIFIILNFQFKKYIISSFTCTLDRFFFFLNNF